MPAPGVLQMMISHRFGRVNGGLYELFGLDQANMRMGFSYGIQGNLNDNLLQEEYYRFTFGVTFNEKWFVRRKFD